MLTGFTKSEKGWIMYDWANSAYSILVASLLPIYSGAVGGAEGIAPAAQASQWAWAVSLSALIVGLLAPVLGSMADYRGMRKRLFTGFFVLGVSATALLSVVNGYFSLLLLFGLTNIGFAGANVFYDAFLVDVAAFERMDKVSAWGYGMGYIGGSTIPFVASVALYILSEDNLAVLNISGNGAIRLSCVLTAVWWALFTIPFFKNVRQVSFIEHERGIFRQSFRRLASTLRDMKKDKRMFRFFIAYFLYINGVGAIIMMASKLASSIGFNTLYIVGGLFLTQIVAFPCSILYDRLGERFTHRRMIIVGIITYIVVCIIGFFMTKEWQFIILACLVGTAQGGIQALSRSYFGKLIPDKRRAGEFFGIYNIFGKFESVLGTMLMAVVLMFTEDVHYGVLPVLAFFIVGGILMASTDKGEIEVTYNGAKDA